MVKLKYKNWDDINIGTYRKLLTVVNDEIDNVDTEIKIVSILCDVDEEKILELPIPEYQSLRNEAQWVTEKIDVKPFAPKTVKLGKEYDVCYDISKLTTAQYIDYQTYLKYNDVDKYIGYILSVFLVPKGKSYGDVPIEEVVKDIEDNMSVKFAQSMCFFFTVQCRSLMEHILNYSESRIRKMGMDKQTVEILQETVSRRSGDGLVQ